MKAWLTSVAVLLNAVLAFAGEVSKQPDEKAAWEHELQKLSKEKPAEYAEMRTELTLLAELVLAQLGYGTGPFDGILDDKTRSALRAYEKNRGLPVTGDPLSFETYRQLSADSEAYNYRPIGLPFLHVFMELWDRGYVSTRGTWVISGEQMGMPEQTSQIECHRELGKCTEATAVVSGEAGERQLSVDIDTYEIERWDQHEIVTKPLQFGCTRYVRRFNRTQNSVTGIRSTTSAEDACKGIDRSEKYLILSDGFKVYWELEEARRKRWREIVLMSPQLLKLLESRAKSKR